uniref:Uncharacterized protein n=1 Tax=Cannabis sativa TaxID=3483 RepID=A0A803P2C8_CANSA
MRREANPKKSSPVATARDFLTGRGGGNGDGEGNDSSVPRVGVGNRAEGQDDFFFDLEREVGLGWGVKWVFVEKAFVGFWWD